jgi:hypothetical protein
VVVAPDGAPVDHAGPFVVAVRSVLAHEVAQVRELVLGALTRERVTDLATPGRG